jgi:hypothetical protein
MLNVLNINVYFLLFTTLPAKTVPTTCGLTYWQKTAAVYTEKEAGA